MVTAALPHSVGMFLLLYLLLKDHTVFSLDKSGDDVRMLSVPSTSKFTIENQKTRQLAVEVDTIIGEYMVATTPPFDC